MALVSKSNSNLKIVTFDNVYQNLISESSDTSTKSKIVESLESQILDAKIPYYSSEKVSSTYTGRYKEYVDFITDKLRLDPEQCVKLMEHLGETINIESNSVSENLALFLSMILNEQLMFFKVSLIILNSDNAEVSSLKSKMIIDGYKLVNTLTDNIKIIFEIQQSIAENESSSKIDSLIFNGLNSLMIEVLNYLIYANLRSEKGFQTTSVEKWFQLMKETQCLTAVSFSTSSTHVISTIESLSTLITLLFLDLEYNKGTLDDDSTFMNDPLTLSSITDHLLHTPSNPIILYAWSIILHRQHTFLQAHEDHKNYKSYTEQLSKGVLKDIELVYVSFVEEAAKLNVCKSLVDCCDLISYDPILPNILGSFVISFVPYIEANYEIVKTISWIMKKSSNRIIQKFFDSVFTDELMILLKAKLPLSLDSFLEIISINSNLAVEELRLLPSYTAQVNTTILNSSYEIDDQQPELLRLTSDINVPIPFESDDELTLCMKKGTKGQLLSSDQNNSTVLFIFEYNGWSLLGRLLRNLSIKISLSDPFKDKTRLLILQKFNDVITDLNKEVIDLIFNSMNAFIGDVDIIDIIFKIFDQALFFKNIDLCTLCLDLFGTLCQKGYSARIWSYIFRSDLFTVKANGNLAFEILEKVEMISGNYKFSINVLKLSKILLSLSLIYSERKNKKLKSQVIDRCTNYAIRVFENFDSWKFDIEYQKYELRIAVVEYLDNVVKSYPHTKNSIGLSASETLNTSFEKVKRHLLSSDTEDLRSVRAFSLILNDLSEPSKLIADHSKIGTLYQKLAKNTLKFLVNLLQFKKAVDSSLFSALEKEIYLKTSLIVKAYALKYDYRILVFDLLSQLVCSNTKENHLSLLSHLGTTYSVVLLKCIHENIKNPDVSTELKIASLRFICNVMENNQKGLSLFLITGSDISSGNSNVDKRLADKSVFKLLKEVVLDVKDHSTPYTYYLLNALAHCIRVWHSVGTDTDDIKFIEKILEFMSADKRDSTWDIEVLSKAVEIISFYLFLSAGKNKNCETKITQLLNDEAFIKKLHLMFKISQRNQKRLNEIKSKLSNISCSEYNLKHFAKLNCKLHESPYEVNFLELLFGTEKDQWSELESLLLEDSKEIKFIEAEISLAKSYGGLITCYCNRVATKINSQYCIFVSSLLKENYLGSSLNFYDDIYKCRVELAFLVILTVSKSGVDIDSSVLFTLLTSTSKLLISKEVSLFDGLVSLNIEYYKPLLRIMILSLSLIKTPDFVTEYSATLVDLFRNIICKSIYVLVSSIRNQALSVANNEFGNAPLMNKQIDDVLIMLSMVKDFFKLESNDNLDSELAEILIDSGAYRSIAQLYASSHLIKINDDEIFMDYSMLFIYEFVQKKAVAIRLIQDGLFHLLTESPISLIIQKGHITPYSSNKSIVRIHKLWVKRILPILLTLSVTFSESIIFELCKFALTFTNQFHYNIQAWLETNSYISQSIIEETEQIILFAKLLNSLDAYNYVSSELGKNIDEVKLIPGLDNLVERKEFVNALDYLLTHPKYLAMKVRTTDGDITISELSEELKSLKDSLLV